MKVSDEEREKLHLALDYLLNTRAGLERIDTEKLKQYRLGREPLDFTPERRWELAWSQPRREFVRAASNFLRQVLGEKIHASELSWLLETSLRENEVESDVLALLANSMRPFWSLFAPIVEGKEQDHFISNILDDLMGVHWGDEPRFFQVAKRTQGSPRRPFRVAYLRRSALDWEKRLAAVGMKPFERQTIVSQAYRTSWEAIRKWPQSIIALFDLVSHPPRSPERVREAYEEDPEEFLKMIQDDGDAYWAEISGEKLEKIRSTFPEYNW